MGRGAVERTEGPRTQLAELWGVAGFPMGKYPWLPRRDPCPARPHIGEIGFAGPAPSGPPVTA